MPASEFALRADDGQSLLARRWLPEGPPRAIVQIAHGLTEHSARYARLAAALNSAGYAVYANDHRGHGPKAARRRSRPFRRRGRLGQGRRRPLDFEPADRRRATRRPHHLPRPFAGLVPWPWVHRQALRRAGRRRPLGLERQAADDRGAGAADRPRGAAAARQARQERPHLSVVVRRVQQAVQARAHALRLALARREGGRRLRRRSRSAASPSRPSSRSTCSTPCPA